MQTTTLEELTNILVIYFQQLLKHTTLSVTQHFNDGENYKHYLSKYPLIYTYHFVEGICDKYSIKEFEERYFLLTKIFSETFVLTEPVAKDVATYAYNLGMDGTKASVNDGWQLGLIIFRLAKRDVDSFTFDNISKQQLDNYNLVLLINNPVT